MTAPHRPDVPTMLLRLGNRADDTACHWFTCGEVRDVLKWVLHLEHLMMPAQSKTTIDYHVTVNYATHELLYEISKAGHILWVTWHRSDRRAKETMVAAIRTRLGWDMNATVAPQECTRAALAVLTGDNDHGRAEGKPI